MPASEEQNALQKAFSWGASGAIAGAAMGAAGAGFTRPPIGETSMGFIVRSSAVTAGELAAIAGVFALGETVVTAVKGPSPVNPAIAGCAAGALLGVRQGSITNAGYGCAIFASLQLMGGFANDFGQIGGH